MHTYGAIESFLELSLLFLLLLLNINLLFSRLGVYLKQVFPFTLLGLLGDGLLKIAKSGRVIPLDIFLLKHC